MRIHPKLSYFLNYKKLQKKRIEDKKTTFLILFVLSAGSPSHNTRQSLDRPSLVFGKLLSAYLRTIAIALFFSGVSYQLVSQFLRSPEILISGSCSTINFSKDYLSQQNRLLSQRRVGFSRSLAWLACGNGISGISVPKKEHNFSQPSPLAKSSTSKSSGLSLK